MFSGFFRGARPRTPGDAARDALAGVQLAAMSIPQALGYTRIAGVPPIAGLYTLLLPATAFAAFGSSGFLVVAADSATAAILAGGLAGMAAPGSPKYVELAAMTALLTGAFLLIARLLRFGFLADFLSQTVLIGFLTGVGFQVGISALGQMLGIATHSHRSVIQLIEVVRNLRRAHPPSVGLAVLVVAGIPAMERFAPKIPGALIAVAGSIAAGAWLDLPAHGFQMIGAVASGLPGIAFPATSATEVEQVLPIAASCFLMIVTQSAAVARSYALRYRETLDENRDLIGLGAANLLAGVSGAFPVNGSPTQTLMAESSGARSQLAQLTMAAVVALILEFFSGSLRHLPQCVLGAIVFTVALHMIRPGALLGIRRESPGEFWVAIATAAVVVGVGVEQGIVLAMLLSLLRIVDHSYRPHTAVLVPGGDGLWNSRPVMPGVFAGPGLVVYRFSSPLFYANVRRFATEIRLLTGADKSPVKCIVVEAGAISRLDYTAARRIEELVRELRREGVRLAFAHVEPELMRDLVRHRLAAAIGRDALFDKLHEAVAADLRIRGN